MHRLNQFVSASSILLVLTFCVVRYIEVRIVHCLGCSILTFTLVTLSKCSLLRTFLFREAWANTFYISHRFILNLKVWMPIAWGRVCTSERVYVGLYMFLFNIFEIFVLKRRFSIILSSHLCLCKQMTWKNCFKCQKLLCCKFSNLLKEVDNQNSFTFPHHLGL